MFQFLSDKIKLTYLFSELKLKESDYSSYLKYYLISFILDLAKDLSSFPIAIESFKYRKKSCYEGEWGLSYEDLVEIPIEGRISRESFETTKSEVYDFIFQRFPLIIGIEKKYLEVESSFDEYRKDYGFDWYLKAGLITNGPFKYYNIIELFVENMLGKNNCLET